VLSLFFPELIDIVNTDAAGWMMGWNLIETVSGEFVFAVSFAHCLIH